MNDHPNEGDGSGESEESANNAASQTPIGIEQGINREAGAQPRQNKESGGIPRRWEIGIGAFLAVVNFAALFIYGYQLIEMRKATNAATEGLKSARDMSHLDQRAWVSGAAIEGTPKVGKSWTVDVLVKNTGKTFARKMKMVALADSNSRQRTYGLENYAEDSPEYWKQVSVSSMMLLAPNGQFIGHATFNEGAGITQRQIDTLKMGDWTIIVHGKIIYEDVFGCPHWTTFCGRYEARTETFTACDDHNDDDNNNCP